MSYIGMKKTYSTLAEVFTDICTILTTVGWTLHDELSSTNKVFKSRGEKDVYAPAYLRVYNSGSYVEFYAWQYWNLITHSGILSGYTTPSRTTYGENFIAANKDFIVCANATYSGGAAFIPNLFHTLLTTTTDSISAGSSVTIPVVSSSGFKVGNRYQILGQNYEGRERVTINSIPDSTSVVVASLATSYASGAYLGINPCPFGLWSPGNNGMWHGFVPLSWYDSSGTTTNSNWLFFTPIIDSSQNADMWPDNYADEYILAPGLFYSQTSNRSGLWGYTKEYLLASYPGGTSPSQGTLFDIVGVSSNSPESGQATSGGNTTLTDTSKSWTTNQWQNKWIIIVNGTGVGQSRKISSNTSDTITVVTQWVTNPDPNSVYRIVDESWRHLTRGLYALETQNSL
jgi:hypothetical protein